MSSLIRRYILQRFLVDARDLLLVECQRWIWFFQWRIQTFADANPHGQTFWRRSLSMCHTHAKMASLRSIEIRLCFVDVKRTILNWQSRRTTIWIWVWIHDMCPSISLVGLIVYTFDIVSFIFLVVNSFYSLTSIYLSIAFLSCLL